MAGGPGLVLVAVVLGSVLTLVAQVLLELLRDARRSEQLSHAIAGEVFALLQIIESRGYLEMVKTHFAEASAGRVAVLKIHIEQTFFAVIEANLQHIGILPVELPLLVPKFLTLSKAAIEDVSFLNGGEWDSKSANELAEMYRALSQGLEAITTTGTEIVSLISKMYGNPHGRYRAGLRIRMFFRKIFSPEN